MGRVALTIPIIMSYVNASSFIEANFSSSLDQGKHLASFLNKISLYNIYLCHDYALKYTSLMKP
jgi:hypothetical protein